HHHSGPKHVAFEIRLVCEFLANMVSLLISEKEEREYADYRLKLKTTQGQLLERMLQEDDVVGVLTKGQPNLLDFVDAQGAVVMVNDEITALGETPPPDLIRQLAEALAPHSHEGVFATDSVAKQLLPQASAFKDVASGLLALRFSASKNDYLMWFRPEVLRTVNWSGDPRKPVDTSDDGQRLLPRTSFALWRETVRLKSKPWSEMELRVTREFRVAILELVLRRAEKLGELYDKLATSYLELDSFTYVASHDLKEPLRGIHNYARFLLEDCVGYLQKEDVAKLHAIVRLSRRMEGLLDSLLHYSRMSRRELETTACDVNVVVQDVLEMLQARTQESGAKVTVVGHLPEKANADAFILSEIFCNLVVNAMKYNDKPEKQVEIGCLEENGNSTFFVRDNGIGIEPEHFDEIFVMFKRLHALQEFGGGTGAGLTIARKLVQRSGGRIWLESVPGAGSTFYFSLEKDRQERGCT
ncbi:MAG: cyanobacterial phytochrome A, partial [Acidobacteriales bacterium]|nr:cyanobacterial phytochrome A [Terriglobales bacterium]